jgi:hypothetical protein
MNVTHSPRFEELLPAFALGALDGDELREMQEHLAAGCAACDAQLAQLLDLMEGMAQAFAIEAPALPAIPSTAETAVGADLRRKILAQVAGLPPSARAVVPAPIPFPAPAASAPARRRGRLSWLAAAAAAAVLSLGAWGAQHQAGLNGEIARLRNERSQLAARADGLQHRLDRVQSDAERLVRSLSVVGAPGVQQVSLSAMGGYRATGRTYVDAHDRKAVFYASNLPPPQPGKTYELWFIDEDDHKTAAGTFGVDREGKATVLVDQTIAADRITAWVVTLEPAGGVPQPTGPIVMAG